MFCRTCGESNDDYSIYCCKDGTMLHTNSEKNKFNKGGMYGFVRNAVNL